MRTTLWPVAGLVVSLACGSDAPTLSPFGLDQRPANATCTAKPRPVINTGVGLARQWAGVAFNQPIYLTQAPGDDTQWYVVEREGKVRAFPATATSDAQTRDFVSLAVNATGEVVTIARLLNSKLLLVLPDSPSFVICGEPCRRYSFAMPTSPAHRCA